MSSENRFLFGCPTRTGRNQKPSAWYLEGSARNLQSFLVTLLLGLLAWTPAVTASPSIWVDYYTPQFFVDKLVFFDDAGTPYYYEDDQAYAVPEDHPDYQELVNHYMENVDGYLRWFDEVGNQNLEYRLPPKTEYYKPEYYQDYPIFYTGDGRPYYYLDGLQVYVKVTDPFYNKFVHYYKSHHDGYVRWYRERGRHYRWYRRPLYTDYYHPIYYDGYVVYFDPVGLPFVYRGGLQIYIDCKYPRYDYYVKYYKIHRDKYYRWYHELGQKHRNYRLPKGYWGTKLKVNVTRAMHGRAVNPAEHRRNRNMKIVEEWRLKHRSRKQERRDSRLERRKERFDKRLDRRQDRLDKRLDRRQDRFDKRMDHRKDRFDKRIDRREKRHERRKERKESRQERRKKNR